MRDPEVKKKGFAAEAYQKLASLGRVTGALTFLFGIVYGLEQYVEKQHEGRINQTLDLFKQFDNPPFSAYRINLTKAYLAHGQDIADASLKGPDALETTIQNIVDKAGIETDLLMTIYFFDALYTCVEKNLCDRDMTQRLFSPRARELILIYFQYIEERRKAGADFGIGLQLVAQMKPPS